MLCYMKLHVFHLNIIMLNVVKNWGKRQFYTMMVGLQIGIRFLACICAVCYLKLCTFFQAEIPLLLICFQELEQWFKALLIEFFIIPLHLHEEVKKV